MRFDLIERFLSYTFQPVASAIKSFWRAPVDTVVDAAVGAGEFVQEYPLTCMAVVGCAYYAHKHGYLKLSSKVIGIDVHMDTRIGGGHISAGVYRGDRSKYR